MILTLVKLNSESLISEKNDVKGPSPDRFLEIRKAGEPAMDPPASFSVISGIDGRTVPSIRPDSDSTY